eukprot:scaffold166030_cov32-Prasinocladus_malaysianus.AAC.3
MMRWPSYSAAKGIPPGDQLGLRPSGIDPPSASLGRIVTCTLASTSMPSFSTGQRHTAPSSAIAARRPPLGL